MQKNIIVTLILVACVLYVIFNMLSAQKSVRDFCLNSNHLIGIDYDKLTTIASSYNLKTARMSENEAVISNSTGGPESPMCFIELSKGLVAKVNLKEF